MLPVRRLPECRNGPATSIADLSMETAPMKRTSEVTRKTRETEIALKIDLDGDGSSRVSTGIAFFDHMLDLFARHGLFLLEVVARGDIEVDYHHTVEDTGIVLGQAFARALGDRKGLRRYGHAYVPMDETLARSVVDFSGRPYLAYRAPAGVEAIGTAFSFQLVEEFLRGFAVHAAANVHVEILYGKDAHHMAEAVFKSLARACCEATRLDPRVEGIPSTKGMLV